VCREVIMKIYTRRGDDGTTGLFGGGRVDKDHRRVEAYGGLDELNASVGWVRALIADAGDARLASIDAVLDDVQFVLFDLGGELATSPEAGERVRARVPHVDEAAVARLEAAIDAADTELPPQTRFILPGGHRVAAALHLARTTCRAAERRLVALGREEPVRAVALAWVNRLSDLLFTLARLANHRVLVSEPTWDAQARAGTGNV
jgi:cob(I)alamin adenosyltransferase